MLAEIKVGTDGKMYYRNPMQIDIIPFFDSFQTNRFLSQVRKAGKQLPEEGPCLVHIEIPYKMGSRFFQVADGSFDVIFDRLRQHHGRINAVVLSGSIISRDRGNTSGPIIYRRVVIPNNKAKAKLPKWFSILGTHDQGFDMGSEEGSLLSKFQINSELPKQQGVTLFFHSSKDGQHQIRMWQTFANLFRIEVVTPVLGRICLDVDLNDMKTHQEYSLGATWSKGEMNLYLNGQLLARRILAGTK